MIASHRALSKPPYTKQPRLSRSWRRLEPFEHIEKGTIERGACGRFQLSPHELAPHEIAKPADPGRHDYVIGGMVITGPQFGCIHYSRKA